jgi:hypothetical protein
MNEPNVQSFDTNYPQNIGMIIPEEQSSGLKDALVAVTQVLARYELADHLAKTDDTIGEKRHADHFCVAVLENNQDDLAHAIPDATALIDSTYVNQILESLEDCQLGASINYDVLRKETKLAIAAAAQLKDDVIDVVGSIVNSIEVDTPFGDRKAPELSDDGALEM